MIIALAFELERDIFISPTVPLCFDDWFFLNESSIELECSMMGTDGERDFDLELEFENRYEKYLKKFEDEKKIYLRLRESGKPVQKRELKK